MVFILAFLFVTAIALCFPSTAHAIIVIPALILIPIAKLVALIAAAFSIPLASVGVFIRSVTKNRRLGIIISISILALVILVSVLILHHKYPENPWF